MAAVIWGYPNSETCKLRIFSNLDPTSRLSYILWKSEQEYKT